MYCKFKKILAFFVGGIFIFSDNALAFGDQGHEIIAALAYPQLTPKAKVLVDRMLLSDKDELTPQDFISRSTWADKYRDSDRNSSKIHYHSTQSWHYIDLDLDKPNFEKACNLRQNIGKDRLASQGGSDDCIVDKLEQFITELKNPKISQAEKILALKFILHLVGDLHQPLHTADHNDRGGNQLSVRFYNQKTRRFDTTNLHSYWDHQPINDLGEQTSIVVLRLSREISQSDKKSWTQGSIRDWALESNHLAKKFVYEFKGLKQFKDKDDQNAYILNKKYQAGAQEIVAIQLKKAGVRLAYLLNEAFDQRGRIN